MAPYEADAGHARIVDAASTKATRATRFTNIRRRLPIRFLGAPAVRLRSGTRPFVSVAHIADRNGRQYDRPSVVGRASLAQKIPGQAMLALLHDKIGGPTVK